ncbi:MAG: hypothetical protein DRO04_00625 [Candidatus Iainarchaeum archaeon]|uniref:VapC9 PIN-like domain-containing protein n=1 Tax=Candidatus Iainarchaeum sp. TaxID=3101447 RepID=A0A497JI55_9ARCH|nr:MAG: hypothetical protein DRO04_00625 [Candidatus Diapherotrites archaeon]
MARCYSIAIDTNILLYIEKFKVDVFTQLKEKFGRVKFYIPKQVMEELKKISEKGKKLSRQVAIAEKLLKKHDVRIKNISDLNADEALLKLAEQGFIIATNDKQLRDRIKEKGGKVLIIRQKKFVEEF